MSERPNKGKKPERLGSWLTGSLPEEEEDGAAGLQSTPVVGAVGGLPPSSVSAIKHSKSLRKSSKSHRSVTSAVSQASIQRMKVQAELSVAEKMAELDRERENRERELDREREKRDRERAAREYERQKSLLEKSLALELLKIEEEALTDEDLSDNSDSTHYADNNVKSWVESQQGQKYDTSTIAKDEQKDEKVITGVKESKVLTENKNESNTSSIVQDLTLAITNAMQNISINSSSISKSPDDMRKYIARQSIAKVLPDFYGDPAEWPAFYNQYTETTAACGFSQQENLCRLQKSLKGKAKESVSAMLALSSNVDEIIRVLKMNFGESDYIINTLIDKAKKMSPPKEDKPESLIDFSNAVRNIVQTMKALKDESHMCNPHLREMLVEKLPFSLKLQWGITSSQKAGAKSVEDFGNWLETIARAAIVIRNSYPSSTCASSVQKEGTWKRRKEHVFTTDNKEHLKKSECVFCNKPNHKIVDCREFAKESEQNRRSWAIEKRLCFGCLNIGHSVKECRKKQVCGKDGCKYPHHALLHKSATKSPETAPTPEAKKEDVVLTVTRPKPEKKVLACVLPVTIIGPKCEVKTFAMLDSGAKLTLIDKNIATQVGAFGPKEKINLKGITPLSQEYESEVISLKIRGSPPKEFKLANVKTVPGLELPEQKIDFKKMTERWPYLLKATVQDLCDVKPTILIGEDNADLIVSRENLEGPKNAPIASRTKLGWVVHGNSAAFRGRVDPDYVFATWEKEKESSDLHNLVKGFFGTEEFGVKITANRPRCQNDIRASAIIDKTMKRIGNRFETGLLWSSDEIKLPESKFNAMKRLSSMERKMDLDPIFAKAYCDKIQEYLGKGYARYLTSEEAAVENNKTWYLPHFAVFNVNKPGKLRLIFDAAAKSHGVSLNDKLLKGPDNLKPIIGVLMRFRQDNVAFTGDIKEMFHQVKIRKEDLSAQRFMWRGMDRKSPPKVLQMEVMIFGASCSPCLAQEAKNRNAMEFAEEFPEAAKAITHRHYVDDYLDCVHDDEIAIKRINDVIEVHKRGGFFITNFISSSQNVLQQVSKKYPEQVKLNSESHSKDMNIDSDQKMERVLGLQWNPNGDYFTFSCSFKKIKPEIITGEKRPTKREVLKLVASTYDPLGFISHFLIKAKILLQEIWKSEIEWDEEILDGEYAKWKNWLQELKNIVQVQIPRAYCFNMKYVKEKQLHVFGDASPKAFSAVAYFRLAKENEVTVSFVTAKTRVAPKKLMSVPRLELQAAVMGSRLAQTIIEEHELKIDKIIYWTDSSTVFLWIHSDARKFKPFVAHRIGEIEDLTDLKSWRWIPTKENVADEATRDNKPCDFGPDSRWYRGPEFLRQPESHWPRQIDPKTGKAIAPTPEGDQRGAVDPESSEESIPISYYAELELKKEFVMVVKNEIQPGLPEISRFSNWSRIVRATAWRNRFAKNCLAIVRKMPMESTIELLPAEINFADVLLCRRAQSKNFSEEINELSRGMGLTKNSRLWRLSPYLDEFGLLRLSGRISKAPGITADMKNPIIMDPKNSYTKLIVKFYHEKAGHHGRNLVANEIRQKYWIISLGNAIKSAWMSCQCCKNHKIKPNPPEMGQLPTYRLTRQSRPFAITGVDYFGPLMVKIGRRQEKRWVVLFTCLVTRAVHLELASSLDTDSAIMAITRLIARRGAPDEIHSDNGTNFHGAQREMKEALQEFNQSQIMGELQSKGIRWYFIPPAAPHMGGAWERLVQSVKKTLSAILHERAPQEEVLHTLLLEAERIVNSRPLTEVSVDPTEPESLTPMHFLIGSSAAYPPMGIFDDRDLCRRKRWRVSERLSEHFWQRWVKEYLPTLTRKTKWYQKTEPAKIGDLVIICDNNQPKNSWPRGRITALYPGADGIVRVVDVKTATGTYRRPIAKIAILDVEVEPSPEDPLGGECPGVIKENKNLAPEQKNVSDGKKGMSEENEQKIISTSATLNEATTGKLSSHCKKITLSLV